MAWPPYIRKRFKHLRCCVCGQWFLPKRDGHISCSPECKAERQRQTNAAWHRANKAYHVAQVSAARWKRRGKQ